MQAVFRLLGVLTAGLAAAVPAPAADDKADAVTPLADSAALMPAHGTVSLHPATRWEDSLATGNGRMGALLAGDPRRETLIVNHCKMWLPLGSREVVPDAGRYGIGCATHGKRPLEDHVRGCMAETKRNLPRSGRSASKKFQGLEPVRSNASKSWKVMGR